MFALSGTLLFLLALATMSLSVWDVATHLKPIEALSAAILHSVGAVIISIAILDVARYIFEQEVFRRKKEGKDCPVAATETLKKMFVIISIAISLEGLVYIFKAGTSGDISLLLYPAVVILTSVLAMVGLGIYQWLAAKAEAISPKS